MDALTERVAYLEGIIAQLLKSDRYTIDKTLQIMDGGNIQFGRANGTSLGTAPDQKLSVFGVTPIVQGGVIANPSGGSTVDTQARNAIISIISIIKSFGITS